ncbi:MAG: protein kinase, partial [Kofleriaceae bacterium]
MTGEVGPRGARARQSSDAMSGCLAADDVLAMATGSIAAAAAGPLLAHLGRCDLCRRQVAEAAHAQVADTARPGEAPTIGRYTVLGMLGRGGMGTVYAAHDPQLDRKVALKLVRVDHAQATALQQRLVGEARAMARVQHPNVLTVYDAGVIEDEVVIAMELVDGCTLAAWLHVQPRPWQAIVACFVRAGRGLAAAHAAGVVHRDFKPENVLVGHNDRVRVCDFGLARPVTLDEPVGADPGSAASRLSQAGALIGTLAYMAPEQRRGEPADARSDQFSFCVALREALAAQPARHVWARPPRAVARAVARGLAAQPAARWPAMGPLLAELERAISRRHRVRVQAGLGVLALAGLGLGLGLGAWRPAGPGKVPAIARGVRRLTYAAGCEEYPAFVRGGLVFDGEVDGAQQLFALDLGAGQARALTHAPGSSRAAIVSPDGRRIAYEHQLAGNRELRVMRVDGVGGERAIGPGRILSTTWLDDHHLSVVALDGAIAALDVDDPAAGRRPIYTDPAHRHVGLQAAFADGALAVGWWEPPDMIGVGVVAHGELRVLAEHLPYNDGALRIAPGQDAVYVVRADGAANELVRIPRAGGDPVIVAGGVTPSRGVALASDGRQLVFSTCASHAQVIGVAGDGTAAAPARIEPWSDTVQLAIDARRTLVMSNRSGHDQLYVTDAITGEARAVTELGVAVREGAVSPDGTWLAYATQAPPGLWIAPLDRSTPARRLTTASDTLPMFSRDGRTLVFERAEGVWRVPAAGGPATMLAAHGEDSVPSALDDRVYYLDRETGSERTRLMVVDDLGVATQVGGVLPAGHYWSSTMAPDGHHLALIHEGRQIVELALDPAPADTALQVRSVLPRWTTSLTYTADGRGFLASLDYLDGDLWLAEG